MKKMVIFSTMLMISLVVLSNISNAQCCNVYASNGEPVLASNGSCASLSYPTTVCEPVVVEIIGIEVWVLYYDAFTDVRFATASDELTGASDKALDKVANSLRGSKYILKVSGYADSVGTEDYNKELSAKRAIAVKKALVAKGVDSDRIVLAAYGEKLPKAPNTTKRGRSINRRVEFDLYY